MESEDSDISSLEDFNDDYDIEDEELSENDEIIDPKENHVDIPVNPDENEDINSENEIDNKSHEVENDDLESNETDNSIPTHVVSADMHKHNNCVYNLIEKEEKQINVVKISDFQQKRKSNFTPGNDIFIPEDEYITRPILTKYEYVRLISERTKQISSGAKPMFSNGNDLLKNYEPVDIAKLELKHKVIPFYIIRDIGNNKKELWKIENLENIYQ